jgi:hypothetical protein
MSEDEMRAFMDSPWATDTAVVDTGKGASILNFWEDPLTGKRIPFTDAEAPRAGGILRNMEDTPLAPGIHVEAVACMVAPLDGACCR